MPDSQKQVGAIGPLSYQLYDLVTGNYLGSLPLGKVSFGSTLNAAGSFSGQIDIASSAVQALGPIGQTQPARTALFIDYDGALIWGGVIWPRNYAFDPQTRVLTVGASELWSWVAQRVQATDYSSPPYSGITGPSTPMPFWGAADVSGSEWDPMLMSAQMISDCLGILYGQILGGMGIAINGFPITSAGVASYLASGTNTPAGDYVNFTAPYTSKQTLGTMIPQLAGLGLGVGFDFGVDFAYSAGPGSRPVATINLTYPRRGRTYAQDAIIVNSGTAITYTAPEDGTQAANCIYEQGANGSVVIATNIDSLAAGWPLLEKVISRSNITSANMIALLTELGPSDLFLYSFPVVTPSVTVDLFGPNPQLGTFLVGDDCRWIIPATDGAGSTFDPRFPQGLDQEWRIASYSAQVADEGQSLLQLTLNQSPALVVTGPAI